MFRSFSHFNAHNRGWNLHSHHNTFKYYSQLLKAKVLSTREAVNFEITDSAVGQIQSLYRKHPTSILRVAVEAGGCHGFQYKFSLDKPADDSSTDLLFESETNADIKILCDSISWKILKNSKLDYSKELIGSSFQIVDNPAASSGCGCGTSFDLKE